MTSAWTNMSFAIKHRDIEREWENRGGVMVIFLKIIGDSCSVSEDVCLLIYWNG